MAENRISDLQYEQLLLDELSKKEKDDIMGRPGSSKRLEDLKLSNTEILFNHPPSRIAAEISSKMTAAKISFRFLLPKFASGVAAVALIAIAVINPAPPVMKNEIRTMGSEQPQTFTPQITNAEQEDSLTYFDSPRLEITRMEKKVSLNQLHQGDILAENDEIMLKYSAKGRKYGMIFSIDGTGFVSLHYPSTAEDEPILNNSAGSPLDYALQIDNAPSFEKFYFVTSIDLFEPDTILNIARLSAEYPARVLETTLNLPSGFEQQSVTFYKEDK